MAEADKRGEDSRGQLAGQAGAGPARSLFPLGQHPRPTLMGLKRRLREQNWQLLSILIISPELACVVFPEQGSITGLSLQG